MAADCRKRLCFIWLQPSGTAGIVHAFMGVQAADGTITPTGVARLGGLEAID